MLRHRIELTVSLAFLLSVLVLMSYLTSAGLHSSHIPYYEWYGKSLARARLWVEKAATPEQCDYDLSFYKGRCYPCWGIAPAVVHCILPFISDRFLTLIGCTIGVYFLLKTLGAVAFGINGDSPGEAALPFYLFAAFGTGLPALCLASRVYEEAIAVAYAFGFAGIYYATPLLTNEDVTAGGRPVTSSLCLALAGLCRLPWMGLAFLLNIWLVFGPTVTRRPKTSGKSIVLAMTPLLIACSLQLGLNYARFEDPFDFGYSRGTYHAELIASGKKAMGLEFIGANSIYNLVVGLPPSANPLDGNSPSRYPWISELFQSKAVLKEFALGLFVVMPSLVLGIPLLVKVGKRNESLLPVLFVLPPAIASLAISSEVYRYQLEIYLPFLLLLIPLAREQAAKKPLLLAVHWVSFLTGMAVTLVNTMWIVRTVCSGWRHC